MRARNAIIGIIAALITVIGIQSPALADTREDMIATDEVFGMAFDDFVEVFNSSTATLDEVIEATDGFALAAGAAADEFRGHAAAAADPTMRDLAERFAVASEQMAEGATAVSAAILAEDQTAYDAGIETLAAGGDDYAALADAFNSYLADNPIASGDPMYALWFVLLIIAILFLIGTIVLLVLARKQHGVLAAKPDRKGNVRQTSLSGLRWTLFGLAAVFVVGAAIPFVQYWFIAHDGGGEYRVFWYPLAIGGVGTIIVAIQYAVAVRKVRRDGSAAPIEEVAESEPTALDAAPSPQTVLNGQPLPPEPPR